MPIFCIYRGGQEINRVVADDRLFLESYCAEHGCTYEEICESGPLPPEPTEQERMRADIDFVAAMAGVML